MKKSNIILLSFTCFLFLSAFAIHAALDAQYRKGKFTLLERGKEPGRANGYSEAPLAGSFSKVVIDAVDSEDRRDDNSFWIVLDSSIKNTLYIDTANPKNVNYRIDNDTLFLTLRTRGIPMPAKLSCNNISYIQSNAPVFLLAAYDVDKLVIRSSARFVANEGLRCNNLSIFLTGDAYFSLDNNRHVDTLSLDLKDRALFESKNSIFKIKNASFGDSCSVNLTGRSLQNFKP